VDDDDLGSVVNFAEIVFVATHDGDGYMFWSPEPGVDPDRPPLDFGGPFDFGG
jgi:hypothetical protein